MIDIKPPSFNKRKKESESKKSSKSRWLLVALLLVFLALSGAYFKYYRVHVEVWPATESFSTTKEIVIGEDDFPSDIFKEVVEGKDDFLVKGKKKVEVKAEGVLTVCQNMSYDPVPIREGTRFVSEDGKLFNGKEAFTIPGRTENEPGCTEVEVIAAEPGEDYNLSSSASFSLPGISPDLRANYFAESLQIETEGRKDEVLYLDSDEISEAEDILSEKLFEKGKTVLRKKYGDDFLVDGTGQYNSYVLERSLPQEGEKEEFKIEMKLEVEIMTTKKEKLDTFFLEMLPEGHVFYDESSEMSYSFSRTNFETGSGEMNVQKSAQTYEDMRVNDLKRDVAGMSFEEARYKLESRDSISEARFRFYPFGLSFVPGNVGRIDLELMFDKN